MAANNKDQDRTSKRPEEQDLKALAVLLGWDDEVDEDVAPVDLRALGQCVGEVIVRGTQRRRRR